jgi:hypothetical protein
MTRQRQLLDAVNRAVDRASREAAERYGIKMKKPTAKSKSKTPGKSARKVRAAAE